MTSNINPIIAVSDDSRARDVLLHAISDRTTPDVHPFIFNSEAIRVVIINGAPHFVVRDVCEVLGIVNPTQAVQRLESDEFSMFNLGKGRPSLIVSESGLYALVLSSRKPMARAFRKWVTAEVLPSIRKTGGFATLAPKPSAPPHVTFTGDLALAEAASRMLNISESGRIAMLTHVAKTHGLDVNLLPRYAIDAPMGLKAGSSEDTSSATALLKAHDSKLSAARFYAALARLGYMQKCSRETSQLNRYPDGVKHFWKIEARGLVFGKNIVDAQSPRETKPHWFVSRFAELLDIVHNADEGGI